IANPFATQAGARIYRTGDLVRYLTDGNIEFLGRVDQQVKVRGYRIELSEIEAALSQHPAINKSVVVLREDRMGEKRLVAYIVSLFALDELRDFLKQRLPDYMVPNSFVFLDSLPLTPNGKVDRQRLPAPEFSVILTTKEEGAPRNKVEAILAQIWTEVLRLEALSIQDNFFELGGDSILSLQVVARASQINLKLTPKMIFQYPTIAELAKVVDSVASIAAEQGIVSGELPLTPIQHWFFEQKLVAPNHWNLALILQPQQPLKSELLREAFAQLLEHHDALRLRFIQTEGGWQQFNVGCEDEVSFLSVDLTGRPEMQQAIVKISAELQTSLNLASGPLIKAVFFDTGIINTSRLLIIIHHLVVDGLSWQILLEDLENLYRQASKGETFHLPPKTSSFKCWANRLNDFMRSEEGAVILKKENNYWLTCPWDKVHCLPVDFPEGENSEKSARTISVTLNCDETTILLKQLPAIYHTQINDLLLAALTESFFHWTAKNTLLIALEGHGREDIISGIDHSRTVGWFTSIFPVLLEIPHSGIDKALKTVKEQLRCIPNRGIGYGLLRYLGPFQIRQQLASLPQPEISFNYLGQLDTAQSLLSIFIPMRESCGPPRCLDGRRRYLIDIDGSVTAGQLEFVWTYSENIHRRETIDRLVHGFIEALRAIIDHCQSPTAGGFTPSDFPQAEISQEDLDEFLTRIDFAGDELDEKEY
ncbi:MAG: condensation domain-containing protein, partial [Acidobacteriota bacterium]